MRIRFHVLLPVFLLVAGCQFGFPRVDVGYRGNGDERILAFMRENYMSSERGVAKYLMRELEAGLQPGQTIDQAYLVKRGAICKEGAPDVCTFNGVANEFFSGMPKENAKRARRITRIEARVHLDQPVRVEIIKDETYPDDPKA